MNAHILLVEDSALQSEEWERSLGSLDYEVTVAADSNEAISAVLKRSPDLILMDIKLGTGASGIDTANLLKAKGLEIPVVYLTANGDPHTAYQAKATAPFGFVTKGSPLVLVQIAVENALARHRLEKESQRHRQDFPGHDAGHNRAQPAGEAARLRPGNGAVPSQFLLVAVERVHEKAAVCRAEYKEGCWIQIELDRKSLQEQDLHEGDEFEWIPNEEGIVKGADIRRHPRRLGPEESAQIKRAFAGLQEQNETRED